MLNMDCELAGFVNVSTLQPSDFIYDHTVYFPGSCSIYTGIHIHSLVCRIASSGLIFSVLELKTEQTCHSNVTIYTAICVVQSRGQFGGRGTFPLKGSINTPWRPVCTFQTFSFLSLVNITELFISAFCLALFLSFLHSDFHLLVSACSLRLKIYEQISSRLYICFTLKLCHCLMFSFVPVFKFIQTLRIHSANW